MAQQVRIFSLCHNDFGFTFDLAKYYSIECLCSYFISFFVLVPFYNSCLFFLPFSGTHYTRPWSYAERSLWKYDNDVAGTV